MQPLLSPDDVPVAKQFSESLGGDCENCAGETVVVDIPTTIDLADPGQTLRGDLDLDPYLSFNNESGDPHDWTITIDVGNRALHIMPGASIQVVPVGVANGTASPGLELRGQCWARIESPIILTASESSTGQLNFLFAGSVDINDEIGILIAGNNGLTGDVNVVSSCGSISIALNGTVRVQGTQVGANDINLVTFARNQDITVAGTVEASFAWNRSPVIRLASFGGGVSIDGRGSAQLDYIGKSRKRPGVRLISQKGFTPDRLQIHAAEDVEIHGAGNDAFAAASEATFALVQPLPYGETSDATFDATFTNLNANRVRLRLTRTSGDAKLKAVFGNLFNESLLTSLTISGDVNDNRFIGADQIHFISGYGMQPMGWDFGFEIVEPANPDYFEVIFEAPGLVWQQLLAPQMDGLSLGVIAEPAAVQDDTDIKNDTKRLNDNLIRVGMVTPLFTDLLDTGTVAIKSKNEAFPGGQLQIQAQFGKVNLSQYALDVANGGNSNTHIRIEAADQVSFSTPYPNLADMLGGIPVLDGSSSSHGATHHVRSFAAGISIGEGVKLDALPNGSHTLISCSGITNNGTVTPPDGNTADDAGACPPQLSVAITNPSDDPYETHQADVSISGTVSMASAEVRVNGILATVQADGTWQAQLTLNNGSHNVVAVARYLTQYATDTMQILVDSQPPEITLNTPESVVQGETLVFDWVVSDPNLQSTDVQLDGVSISQEPVQQHELQVPFDAALTEYQILINAADGFGNQAQPVLHTVVVLPPEVTLGIAEPQQGLLTNSDSVQVTGSVTPAAATVQVNGLDASVNSAGLWNVNLPLTGEGTIAINATATLALGSDSATVGIVRDVTKPELLITAPTTADRGVNFIYEWLAQDASGIESAQFSIGGTLANTLTSGRGELLGSLDPAVESVTFTLLATDRAGNSESTMATVMLNELQISVVIDTPEAGLQTNGDEVLITGMVVPAHADVFVDQEVATVTDGEWQLILPLEAQGDIEIIATAILNGLEATDSRTIFRDSEPPQLTLTAPETVAAGETWRYDYVAQDQFELADVRLFRNDVEIRQDAAGFVEETVPEDSTGEEVTLRLEASDTLGNSDSTEHVVNIQSAGLELAITHPEADLLTREAQVVVSGTVSPAAATVMVEGVQAEVDAGTWSATVPLTVEGQISLTATASFAEQTADAAVTITRDITPPSITFDAPTEVQRGAAFGYQWTAEDPHGPLIVSVRDSNEQLSNLATGTASYTAPSDDTITSITFTVVAEDALGNSDDTTHTVNVNDLDLSLVLSDGNGQSPLDGSWTNVEDLLYGISVGSDVVSVTVTSPSLTADVSISLVDQAGTWSAESLDEGSHTVTFSYAGPNGESGSQILNLNIDRTSPTLDWLPPAQVDEAVVVDFTATLADALSGLATAHFSDGSHPDVTYSDTLELAWQWSSAATPGVWTIDVVLTDVAGNAYQDQVQIQVGELATGDFAIQWQSPQSGIFTKELDVPVTGSVTEGQARFVRINGQEATLQNGTFSLAFPLPEEGLQWLELIAEGTNGETIALRRPITVDRTPPEIDVAGGLIQRGGGETVNVRGRVFDIHDPFPTLSVVGKPSRGVAINRFSFDGLGASDFPLELIAEDHLGNTANETVTWQPDDSQTIDVTLSATPASVSPVGSFVLRALATLTGAAEVAELQLFETTNGTPQQIASAQSVDALNHIVQVADFPATASRSFMVRALALDGGSDEDTVNVALGGDLLLEGYVYDAQTGHPLPQASVTAMPGNVALSLDQDGGYRAWLGDAVDYVLVSASGFTAVQIQGPFLPGEVRQLADARLTALGDGISGSLTPANAWTLASATNPAIALQAETDLPEATTVSWNTGGVNLTELGNQSLPTLLPLGWWPHTALALSTGSGSGSWRGPPLGESLIVSFAVGEAGWRVEAPGDFSWDVSLQPERSYAWVVADTQAPQLSVGAQLISPNYLINGGNTSQNVTLQADPPISVAREGVTSLAVFRDGSVTAVSGQRVLMLRSETYRAVNPVDGETRERDLPQQVVLYRYPSGGTVGYLPLVPRRDTLLATIRSAQIGGPVQPVAQDAGHWVESNRTVENEVLPGWVFEVSGSERFWYRAASWDASAQTFFDWDILGAFRLDIAQTGVSPNFALNMRHLDPALAGRVALLHASSNSLGAAYRVVGLLNASGGIGLLPGRSWDQGRYVLVASLIDLVVGEVSLNPAASGEVRVMHSILGDQTPGYIVLTQGTHFLQGRASNGAEGVLEVDLSGTEPGTQTWDIDTEPAALRLVESNPSEGGEVPLAPQFMLAFNREVDQTTVTASSLVVRVNGSVRQARWRWEQDGERVWGQLRTLIDDPDNDQINPGDNISIAGHSAIRSVDNLALEPFTINAMVPAAAEPLPLDISQLLLTHDGNQAEITLKGPAGPLGTVLNFVNDQNGANGNMVQVSDYANMKLLLDADVPDPIEVTLIGPNGSIEMGRLSLYYDDEPTAARVAFTVGPEGGTFEIPGSGTFKLPEGQINDVRDISFERYDVAEPDLNYAAGVERTVWIIRGLENENGVPEMLWTPDITFDENGEPLEAIQMNQGLPYLPDWLRAQYEALGETVPDRAYVELASPYIQQTYKEIPVRFVSQQQLGEAPAELSGKLPFLSFAYGLLLSAENAIAMEMGRVLSGGLEGRGAVKFGRVGAFDYKADVVGQLGNIRASGGQPVGGAWVIGPTDDSPGNRPYPVTIALTNQEGGYWATSAWWFSEDDQSFGLPRWASHPAFLSLAELIHTNDRAEQSLPTSIYGTLAPERWIEREFGFWYVDPEGGIGTSRPPNADLVLDRIQILDESGNLDPVAREIFELTGKMPSRRALRLQWIIDESTDLEHTASVRMDREMVPHEIFLRDGKKVISTLIPNLAVGSHLVKITVRNQYGFEYFDNYPFLVTPDLGDGPLEPSPEPPFILRTAVRPIPVTDGLISEAAQGVGEIGDGELIHLPFSEQIFSGTPEQLQEQIKLEIAPLGDFNPDYKPWPVTFLHGDYLEEITDSSEMSGIYLRPEGTFPGGHVLRVTVLADGGIRDTGFEAQGPIGLEANSKFDDGAHYQARWATQGVASNVEPFTRNPVVDYTKFGNWLFELTWSAQQTQIVNCYKVDGAGRLKLERTIDLKETDSGLLSAMNYGAREIAFWPTQTQSNGVPGYIIVGYQVMKQSLGNSATKTLRPARLKVFDPNRELGQQVIGGIAFGDEVGEKVRHLSVDGNLVLATTQWSGVFVVDMVRLVDYYRENGFDNVDGKPFFNVPQGRNQPAAAVIERYFPLQYPSEFTVAGAIGSPYEVEPARAPRALGTDQELIFFGTGGIEFGAWFHGNPPIEFLLSGFDAGYSPFDPSGPERYNNRQQRLKNWDLNGDRVDDRRIYFSGDDERLANVSAILGQAAIPSKFSPIMIKVLHQVQTELMPEPRDVLILRSNPREELEGGKRGDVHGGLMFAIVESSSQINYLAYLRFNSEIKNIDVNQDLQQVATVANDGRVMVIDVPTWIDLGLQFDSDPSNAELVELNAKISDPSKPNKADEFLPGLLIDEHIGHARFPLAFMDDRLIVGDDREQSQIRLRPPLFINPGFYTEDSTGKRSRIATIEVISDPDDTSNASSATKVKVSFHLREDAVVDLQLVNDQGGVIKTLYEGDEQSPFKAGKGLHLHEFMFPLKELNVSEADVERGNIPMALSRKLRLVGAPVVDPSATEDVQLWVELLSDPWGAGPAELELTQDVEPWSGRVALMDKDLPDIPAVGLELPLERRYSSHGFWSGSLGRGWHLPWDAFLLWRVRGGEANQLMEVHLPEGEVVRVNHGDFGWEPQGIRFEEKAEFSVDANYDPFGVEDPEGGFPNQVILDWGDIRLVYEYVRHHSSADFLSQSEQVVHSFNNDMPVPEDEASKVGRFVLKEWRKDVGEGLPGEGWVVHYDGLVASHLTSTVGDIEVKLKYRRHPETDRLGLNRIEVGAFNATFEQDEEIIDFLALKEASSNTFPNKYRYSYLELDIGIEFEHNYKIGSLLMSQHRDRYNATTRFTHVRDNDMNNLPFGHLWPHVTRVAREGFIQSDFVYIWSEDLPGRNLHTTQTNSYRGASETFTWAYAPVNEERPQDLFASRFGRNGFTTEVDWSDWPNSQKSTSPSGLEETIYFDALMRQVRVARDIEDDNAPLLESNLSYLGDSRLITEVENTNHVTVTYAYDELGRVIQAHDGYGGKDTYIYSEPHGLATREIDEIGQVSHYRYDVLGRITHFRRQQYTEDVLYRKDGTRVEVAGENGMQYRKNETYEVGSDAYSLVSSMSSNAPVSPSSTTTSTFDSWGRLTHLNRAGRNIYEVESFHLGGPEREVLHWTHRGSERVTTYGAPAANGLYPESETLEEQFVSRSVYDNFGNILEFRDYVNGGIVRSTYNKLHQLETRQSFNLEGSDVGDLLEDISIRYLSMDDKEITRNGQTYTVTVTPGEEWTREVDWGLGKITHTGSGNAYEQMVGSIEGRPVDRLIERSPGQESITQIQSPKSVIKELSGDGRVTSITSGEGTIEQLFTGYGDVRLTRKGKLIFYELKSTNAHFQRTSWYTSGQDFRAVYNGGQLQQILKNNEVTTDVTDWDYLTRAIEYKSGKNRVTVDYDNLARTREIVNRAEDNDTGISTRMSMDGLGRVVQKSIAEVVPDTPAAWKRVNYYFQYGNGIGAGRTGPGDRLIRMETPRKISNYFYSLTGRLMEILEGDPPVSGKRMPDQIGYQMAFSEETDGQGAIIRVVTATGPGGVEVVTKHDEADRLLERSRDGIVLLKQEHDEQGRLILQEDQQGRRTVYRYQGDADVPAQITVSAGTEVHITLLEYNETQQVTQRRERVTRDTSGNLVGGIFWRYTYDDNERVSLIERSVNGEDFQTWQSYVYDINPVSPADHRVEDPSGVTWTLTYDPETGALRNRVNDSADFEESWEVDERTMLYSRGANYFVEIERDYLGRIIRHQVYDHETASERTFDQTWTYAFENDAPTPVLEQHPDGRRVERDLNEKGNPYQTRYYGPDPDSEPLEITTLFDDFQRLESLSSSTGQEAVFTYDRLGYIESETWRLASHTEPLVTQYGYDQRGNQVSTRYPSGRHVQRTYNAAGRLAALYEAGRLQSTYNYDQFGQLVGFQQGGATASYEYDVLGRLSAYAFTTAGDQSVTREETFGYAQVPGLASETCSDIDTGEPGHPDALRCHSLRWGDVVLDQAYAYDHFGRLAEHAVTDVQNVPGMQAGIMTYHYNDLGNLDRVATPFGDQTYLYNVDGSLREQSFGGFRTVFDYDAAGRMLRETEYGLQGLATGFTRDFGYDHRGLLSSVTERGPTQVSVQEFEYDMFSRMRAMRNGNVVENPWSVFTLSQPNIPGNNDLPIPLAAGPRTEEVIFASNISRNQAQVLGYSYGPQGLAHVTAQPSSNWQAGSVSYQFTDPFQNTVAIMSPRALAQTGQSSSIAVALHHGPIGNGTTLNVANIAGDSGEPIENILNNHWDLYPEELGHTSGSQGDAARESALTQTFLPGFSGHQVVGSTLEPEAGLNGEEAERSNMLGMSQLPLANLFDMGSRLLHAGSGSFTSPDAWAMFQPGDHFTANRFLYANADPVNYGDFDGRLASLKTAMSIIGQTGFDDLAINTAARDRVGFEARRQANEARALQVAIPLAMNFVPIKGGHFAEMVMGKAIEGLVAGLGKYSSASTQMGTAVELFGTDLGVDIGADLAMEQLQIEVNFDTVANKIVNFKLPKPVTVDQYISNFIQGIRATWNLGQQVYFDDRYLTAQQSMGLPSYSGDILVDGGSLSQAIGEDLGVRGDQLSVKSLFNSAFCFTGETQVLTAKGLEPIEHIHVGRRVLTYDAEEDDDPPEPPLDPDELRLVSLDLVRLDGSGETVAIQTLIEAAWLAASNAHIGGVVYFSIPEMGVEGPAQITGIAPCPELETGKGELVLSTFRTSNKDYLELSFQGEDQPLEVTENHVFWSADRGDWVAAGHLNVGERLQTLDGVAVVIAIEATHQERLFFNLEVGDDHNYYVTDLDLLTHNAVPGRAKTRLQKKVEQKETRSTAKPGQRHKDFDVISPELPDKFAWGRYLLKELGWDAPEWMYRKHAHHLFPKKGSKKLNPHLREAHDILRKRAGIEPYFDVENLVWAPNGRGSHSEAVIMDAIERLKKLDRANGTPEDFRRLMKQLRLEAFHR